MIRRRGATIVTAVVGLLAGLGLYLSVVALEHQADTNTRVIKLERPAPRDLDHRLAVAIGRVRGRLARDLLTNLIKSAGPRERRALLELIRAQQPRGRRPRRSPSSSSTAPSSPRPGGRPPAPSGPTAPDGGRPPGSSSPGAGGVDHPPPAPSPSSPPRPLVDVAPPVVALPGICVRPVLGVGCQ